MNQSAAESVFPAPDAPAGDTSPASDLFPQVYEQLKELARQLMASERKDHTLQATALVHEAYVRLSDGRGAGWEGRTHFFNAAALAMRRVLVDHARSHGELKHGGNLKRLPLEAMNWRARTVRETCLRWTRQ